MGVIEAIKKGFGVAAKYIGLVTVLVAFNLVWNLASMPFVNPTAKPELSPIAALLSIFFILVSIFIQSGSLALVRDFVKEGKNNLANFVKYGSMYYLRLLGLGLLIILIISIIGLLVALIIIATAPLNNTVVTVMAALIAIAIGAIGLYYILLLILSPYIIVCEELGVIESMKRSIKIVRRSIGKILLLLVVLILISMALGFLIGLLTGILTLAIPAGAGQVIIGIVNSIFNGYLGIVMMASFMVFYLGLIQKEKTSAQKVF
jgi:hypothetical protein